ncbi:MAG: hypothetical protein OQK04_19595 [Kangiellaceae bacterium]|nr:hypothetical protein [Kangiellaceae bacterium]MCW9000925.1 hypothetical protein [Kangiellaceae bacterium]
MAVQPIEIAVIEIEGIAVLFELESKSSEDNAIAVILISSWKIKAITENSDYYRRQKILRKIENAHRVGQGCHPF